MTQLKKSLIQSCCIVLLAKQGKVKLDEDSRIYLPWFTKQNTRHFKFSGESV